MSLRSNQCQFLKLKYPNSNPSRPESNNSLTISSISFCITRLSSFSSDHRELHQSSLASSASFCFKKKKKKSYFMVFHFYHHQQTSTNLGPRPVKVPIIISIQPSASKWLLIINSAVIEKTVMFHGRRLEDEPFA